MSLSRRVAGGAAVLGALLAVSGPAGPAAQAQVSAGLPDVVGQWTEPFEEGGAGVPRCVDSEDAGDPDGFIVCKAVAQAAAVLPDGRIVYYNGLEATENSTPGPGPAGKLPPASRDSQTRVLDLRSGTPTWVKPAQERGGQTNENISDGQRSEDSLFGYLGVPGRPGDGLVGSLAGAAGVPEQQPTSPPDDTAANDGDMFCADVVSLADGRVLAVGGTDWYNEPALMDRNDGDPTDLGVTELEGLPNSNLFDPQTNTWTPGARMKYGRWYPGLVNLPDGKVLVTGGTTKLIKATQLSQVRRTETYDPTANSWTENYVGLESENSLPQMPRLVLAPNGQVFYTGVGQMWGPAGQAADEATYALQQFFDLGTKTWQVAGLAPVGARSGAAVVPLVMKPPYDRMTLLTFGGTLGPPPGSWAALPLSTLTTVDSIGNVTNEMTGSLNHSRWFSSGVLLPDGQVLAVAGADKDEVIDPGTEIPVKVPELYNPATGTWAEVATHTRDRTYHNSALLLPDMRVLLGGHTPLPAHYGGPNQDQGGPFANNDKDSSFEVWSPPYLFRGERPVITGVQAGVAYGEDFAVRTPQAGEIESVQLIKTPSPQHVIDSEQRILELAFTRSGADAETLLATAPPDGVAATPGWYYLVVNRSTPDGPVPSVARMVQVGLGSDPAEALQPFADDAPAPLGGSATPAEDTSQAAATQQGIAEATAGTPAEPVGHGVSAGYEAIAGRRWLLRAATR